MSREKYNKTHNRSNQSESNQIIGTVNNGQYGPACGNICLIFSYFSRERVYKFIYLSLSNQFGPNSDKS